MREIRKKIVTVGSIGVGKTSLIKRFVFSEFKDEYLSTIGVRVDKKTIEFETSKVHLLIWDLAGEIMENKSYQNYLRGASGVIGIFDITRPNTFQDVQEYLRDVKNIQPDTETIVIGNKVDLYDEAHIDLKVFEYDFLTSAKMNNNVEDSFEKMATLLLNPTFSESH